MKTRLLASTLFLTAVLAWSGCAGSRAADDGVSTRQQDIIYARKAGAALTMDVFTPKANANGAGVIFVVSGGWVSSHSGIEPNYPRFMEPLVKRGYTVFAVVPGSQPTFTIPEIIHDVARSVRFIRHNAATYKVDPQRLGIFGGSAGGHLSLIQALAAPKPNAAFAYQNAPNDPVDAEPSDVKAVAAFFPPTDFFNYGKEGENALGRGILANFRTAFDYRKLDAEKKVLVPLSEEEATTIGRLISPITYASAGDPPTLLIHGDADKLVPIQQSEILVKKLKEVGVPVKLIVKPGQAHGWADMAPDVAAIGDWFDQYLKK
jgi:acetyl esterase/lipase